MNAEPYQRLVDSLANGWRVQAPVYLRRQWHVNAPQKIGYYFIIKKGDDTDLVIVPDDVQIRHLIETQRVKVVAG